MSLSSRERANPPSRRKSCAACIKAKRRCDSALPACLRCHHRQIPCEYPARGRTCHLNESQPATISPSLLDKNMLQELPVINDFNNLKDPALDLSVLVADTETPENLPLTFDIDFDDMQLIQQSSTLAPPTTSKDFEHIADVVAKRLQWAIDEMKKAPISMILETQTPWCHSQLYADGMPTFIRDAHACCALYMAKNPVNGPVILRSIEARVHDLVNAPLPSSPLECLAHTQSIILYQIIRVFDGDITSRASADRLLPMLEESAIRLLAHVNFDTDMASVADMDLYPIAPVKEFWTNWVFQESCRRTLLFAFFFAQTYRLISGQKGLHCDGRLGLCHSWTLSAQLWRAKTPIEFAKACKDRKYFVVTDAQFKPVLEQAQADDVDSFGRILISCLLGIEEAEGWFALRGGSLDYKIELPNY